MLTKKDAGAREGLVDFCWLSLAFFIFYNLWLGSYPLFTPDEGRYSAIAREMMFTHDYITPRLNGIPFLDKPILYYWLQVIAMQLFGVTEWALRFFPMLCGVMSSLCMYGCARLCFNRRTAIFASLILATSPLYFCGAHYANLDLEVAAFISMTLLFFLSGIKTQQASYYYAAYCCAALAFLTKGMIGIAFPTMIVGLWILLNNRWDLLRTVSLPQGIGLFFLLVSPWYILAQQATPDFFHFFFVTQQVTRFLSAADFNNQNAWWFYIPVVIAGFFPWSIYLFQSLHLAWQKRRDNPLLYFVLIWFFVIFIFFSIPRSKTVGYILSTIPPLALLCGYYLDVTMDRLKVNGARFSFIVMCLLLSCSLFYIAAKHPFDLTAGFTPFLYTCAILLLLSVVTALFIKRPASLFTICFTTSALFLLTLVMGATYLNQTTAKPLLTTLARVRKPQDEIINYYKFYQDLPVYLGQRITLVADWDSPNIANRDNWVRELWYGMAMQKDHAELINLKTFLARWHSDKCLFVFLNKNYFQQFQVQVGHFYAIDTYNDIILVSNKAPGTA